MSALIQQFRQARGDDTLAVLEGFHAVKHALRFGAELVAIVAADPTELAHLAAALAPDVAARLAAVTVAAPDALPALAPRAPRTGVIAIARRPSVSVAEAVVDPRSAPVVLLEDPRTMGNMGACVRVAAAVGAAAVLTTGVTDPWHPDALRGAAGLHYALPVARVRGLGDLGGGARPLLAIDPDGEPFVPHTLPGRAILAFGTERHGLSDELLAAADARISLPMEAGVSSLNLATSVAAVLYGWRLLGDGAQGGRT